MPSELYEAAKGYRDRGWSVIPMKMAAKRPAVRWKRYQETQASDSTLRRWFSEAKHGLAVVFGAVSGGLASRDFDDMAAYQQWAAGHPDLARALPTVATHRGRHVYCRASPDHVQSVREALGKPATATGALHLDDGELRPGVGCYSVLPPTIHPKGSVYAWEIELPSGDLPVLDLLEAGLVLPQLLQRGQRVQRSTEAISVRRKWSSSDEKPTFSDTLLDSEDVQHAIESTLPDGPGMRHQLVFELARALKAIPGLNDADVNSLKPIVQDWHRRAQPVIRTQPFEETWIDFFIGWPRVRFPIGLEPLEGILVRAASSTPPAEILQYEQQQLHLLASICRELQRAAGDSPFFLSCRKAGELVGVGHIQANRWLRLMVQDGLLREVVKGTARTNLASRYRYLGAL